MSPRDIRRSNDDAMLAAYRDAAYAEADAHFDERALETQRHKILDRLAHLGQPAKVIRFPKAPLGERPVAGPNRRWLTVAAAAGLLIGLLGGQFVNMLPRAPRPAAPAAAVVAPNVPSTPAIIPAAVLDDGLLGEIDLAVQIRSASALRVLDELTFSDVR